MNLVSLPYRSARRIGSLFVLLCVVARISAGPVAEWNCALLELADGHDALPFHLEARLNAMTHQAIALAVADVCGRRGAGSETAMRSAIATAGREMMGANLAKRDLIARCAQRQLEQLRNDAQKEHGITAGRAAASRVQLARSADGWVELTDAALTVGLMPDGSEGMARTVALGAEPPASRWLSLAPFTLKTAAQFEVGEPRAVGLDGTIRTDITLSDGKLFAAVNRSLPAGALQGTWTERPTRTWNRIAQRLAETGGLSIVEEARLFAALNLALADGGLSAVHWRYVLGTWRFALVETWSDARSVPVRSTDTTAPAVFDGIELGVARMEMRRVVIPPLPNFPALNAVLAGAAEAALVECLKGDRRGFTLGSAEPEAPWERSFGSIREAARESVFVVSIDGRHSRESAVAGYQLGLRIGREAARRVMRDLR